MNFFSTTCPCESSVSPSSRTKLSCLFAGFYFQPSSNDFQQPLNGQQRGHKGDRKANSWRGTMWILSTGEIWERAKQKHLAGIHRPYRLWEKWAPLCTNIGVTLPSTVLECLYFCFGHESSCKQGFVWLPFFFYRLSETAGTLLLWKTSVCVNDCNCSAFCQKQPISERMTTVP